MLNTKMFTIVPLRYKNRSHHKNILKSGQKQAVTTSRPYLLPNTGAMPPVS